MTTIVHGFDWPDRIVIDTIGEPGARSFYLQARDGARVVSVALEKEQSAVLARAIADILDELMKEDGNPFTVPATSPPALIDNDPLDQPVAAEFRVGTLSLGWDPSTAQIVIEAYPILDGEVDEDDPVDPTLEPAEMMIVRMPVGTARVFAERTALVVSAGRPPDDD